MWTVIFLNSFSRKLYETEDGGVMILRSFSRKRRRRRDVLSASGRQVFGDFNKLTSDIFVLSLQFVQPPPKRCCVCALNCSYVEVPQKQLNPDFIAITPLEGYWFRIVEFQWSQIVTKTKNMFIAWLGIVFNLKEEAGNGVSWRLRSVQLKWSRW